MSQQGQISLLDGRQLHFEIRPSTRTRSLRLKMTARDGLTVIAPVGLDERRVIDLVTGKRDWIAAKLDQFAEVRHFLVERESARPEAFDLPALGEAWRVEYRTTRGVTVGARIDRPGRLLVYGEVQDGERCKAALRRWLVRHARESLTPRLESMASNDGLRYSKVIIKNQRTRWGSCSADNVISLNAKLLFLKPQLVRYVLMHELCHTLERNHNSRFWTYLRQLEPQSDLLHGQMQDAWKQVPPWALPSQISKDGV